MSSLFVSESFNTNLSASCVCPPACDIVHYKSSMSYATANENTQRQHDVSEEFLKSVREHLNKSIDTQECTLPDSRRADIEEAVRILSGLPRNTDSTASLNSHTKSRHLLFLIIDTYAIIMKYGLYKMHDIIKNDFSAGWGKMNLHECTSGSFELFTILRESTNEIHQECWRAALRLRLEEKLICSKKAADDLERVHESYINLRPLTNYTATPNGDYDALYRTTKLFRQTTEINQTYTRLRGHIKNYTESINGLLRICKDDHEIEMSYGYINYTNGFWQASADYDRDLRLYESLVIRQPLQIIRNSSRYFENYKASVYPTGWYINPMSYYSIYLNRIFPIYFAFQTITEKIVLYINKLTKEKSASKLSFARMLTASRTVDLFEHYSTDVIPTSQALIRKASFNSEELRCMFCEMFFNAKQDPLLKAFFSKLYDHYNKTTPSDRITMSDYFKLERSRLDMKLVRGDAYDWGECYRDLDIPLKQLRNTILGNVTYFKDMMNNAESFLQTTRLDGPFSGSLLVC